MLKEEVELVRTIVAEEIAKAIKALKPIVQEAQETQKAPEEPVGEGGM